MSGIRCSPARGVLPKKDVEGRLFAGEVGTPFLQEGFVAFKVVLGVELGQGQVGLFLREVLQARLVLHLLHGQLVYRVGEGREGRQAY